MTLGELVRALIATGKDDDEIVVIDAENGDLYDVLNPELSTLFGRAVLIRAELRDC